MKKAFAGTVIAAATIMSAMPSFSKEVSIKLVETTDVHGNYYPEDFISRRDAPGSLARISSFVDEARAQLGDSNVVLLDNGDILQGQPTVYYYNYIDTLSPHLTTEMMNFLGYDAATVGNHDIETGHPVYDRWIRGNRFPMLGANVIDSSTERPYLQPYAIVHRNGIKIAVLGMITPSIPGWLPENLWSGLRFDDMEETARHWIPIIKQRENPDLTVGLFHSGRDSMKTTGNTIENASMMIARHVPGFDIIMMGHDHSPYLETIANDEGDSVIVINPANAARRVGDIDVTFDIGDDGNVTIAGISARLTPMDSYEPDDEFMSRFAPQRDTIDNFVSRKIGSIDRSISTRDSYFGPSAFVGLIHELQLAISGADISFAAPLSFDVSIDKGDINVSDMFNLYKYENMLYTMTLTGREIKDYLEMSYDMWTNTMTSADDHLLKLRDGATGDDATHTGFIHPSYNFDSAAGINYTVDVTRQRGEKIHIISMADGTPFNLDDSYLVAINSYRGNGGGNLLTEGAGIPAEELSSRITRSTDRDLRYYLMMHIIDHPDLKPTVPDNWKFIPDSIVRTAASRDRALLFGS